MGEKDVSLARPTASAKVCRRSNLLENGDMEAGISPWLQGRGSIDVLPNAGMRNSAALSDSGAGSERAALGQLIDVRCLREGASFDIRVMVRLIRGGRDTRCMVGKSCPRLLLRLWTPTDKEGSSFTVEDVVLARSFTSQLSSKSWNLLQSLLHNPHLYKLQDQLHTWTYTRAHARTNSRSNSRTKSWNLLKVQH